MNKKLNKAGVKSISVGAAMADMAMLLLVFFMTTTTTEPPKGVDVEPPSGLVEPAEQESLYITISRQGQYYCDGEAINLDNIRDLLALRAYEKEIPVSITADKNLDYSFVSDLMDVLKEGDFLNVTFMAEERGALSYGRK